MVLIPVVGVALAKVVAYVVGGFATARVWFAKEIKAGRADASVVLADVKAEVAKAEAESVKLEGEAKAEVSKVLSAIKASF